MRVEASVCEMRYDRQSCETSPGARYPLSRLTGVYDDPMQCFVSLDCFLSSWLPYQRKAVVQRFGDVAECEGWTIRPISWPYRTSISLILLSTVLQGTVRCARLAIADQAMMGALKLLFEFQHLSFRRAFHLTNMLLLHVVCCPYSSSQSDGTRMGSTTPSRYPVQQIVFMDEEVRY